MSRNSDRTANHERRPIVLVLLQYFLPGYKSGGPVRSAQGLVDALGDEFEFKFVAYDRDSGDKSSYPGLAVEEWIRHETHDVFYVPKGRGRWRAIRRVLQDSDYDLLYLQSFFNLSFTVWPLLLRRLGRIPTSRVLLAPRGELSDGALGIKKWRKAVFLQAARLPRLYGGVLWHSTSDAETEEIALRGRAKRDAILSAKNLTSLPLLDVSARNELGTDELRVLFLSRITPKKNLGYALEVLSKVRSRVRFSVFGPVDRDKNYWKQCQQLMAQLPVNVRLEVAGPVHPEQVGEVFGKHDLLFLPTKGENFGHVILESLAHGCPVLISDRTPWLTLEDNLAGWALPLAEPGAFVDVIERVAGFSRAQLVEMRVRASALGRTLADSDAAKSSSRVMLTTALRSS